MIHQFSLKMAANLFLLIATLGMANAQTFLPGGTSIAGVADVNGDGLPDMVTQYDDANGARHWQVFLSTGSSFVNSGDWFQSSTPGITAIGLADLNGDGKMDLVVQYDDLAGIRHWQGWISTGTSFISSGDWGNTTTPGMEVVELTDLNGDRKADLVVQYDDNGTRHWQVWPSTGSSFGPGVDWAWTTTSGMTNLTTQTSTSSSSTTNSSTTSATSKATVPSAPTGLSATGNFSSVTLVWVGYLSDNVTYNVKRSTTDGGPYTTIATSITNQGYTDTSVTGGTYYYVVTAVNSAGESGISNQASATPSATPPPSTTNMMSMSSNSITPLSTSFTSTTLSTQTISTNTDMLVKNTVAVTNVVATAPAAPTGLTASATNGSVSLSWNASAGTTSYNIKRSDTSGGPYTTITTGATTTSYSYTGGLTNGATYYFVVSAVNAGGESGNSNQATAVMTISPPTNLSASAGTDGVTLVWTASPGAPTWATSSSYRVKRATTSGGPYTTVTNLNNTVYTDRPTATGTNTFYYVVSALNGTVESANSNQASATPLPPPANFTGTAGVGYVALSWNAVTGATSYRVWMSNQSSTSPIATVTTLAYTNVVATGNFQYYVTARNTSAESSLAGPVSISPKPSTPTGLTATAANTGGAVNLSWTASTGATSYTIFRSTTNGGPYTSLFTTGNTNTTAQDTSVTNGTTYYYVVQAVNGNVNPGYSAYSNQASATPMAP